MKRVNEKTKTRRQTVKVRYLFLLILSMSAVSAYATESSAEQYVEHVIIQQGTQSQTAIVASDLTIMQTGGVTNQAVQNRKAFVLMRGQGGYVRDIAKGLIKQSSLKK